MNKFTGLDTGRVDTEGTPILIGSNIVYTQYRGEGVVSVTHNGWGCAVHCVRRLIPSVSKKITGRVVYDPKWACVRVELDDYMIDSGRKDDHLYCFLNISKEESFIVVD